MPKTMKMLFCSICLTYDCGQHSFDDLTKIVILGLFRKTINTFLRRILSHKNKSYRKQLLYVEYSSNLSCMKNLIFQTNAKISVIKVWI